MNCQKCQDLLSDYLDDSLAVFERAQLKRHLDACLDCAAVRRELEAVVGLARGSHEALAEPPNPRALWLRIRNTVEAELEARRLAEARVAAARAEAEARANSLTRLARRRWELSLPQLAASVAALALAVAAVTAFGVGGLADLAGGLSNPSGQVRAAGQAGVIDAEADKAYHRAYFQQQQARISYWRQRAEQRKASWNTQMRHAFERSVSVYDDTINETLGALDRDPHDEISQEVLDAALREKTELLREFSEQ